MVNCHAAVNILANSAPPRGVEEISNYPKNEEEIRVFYCLALKNEEEIRGGGKRNKEFWPKYLPLRKNHKPKIFGFKD